MIVSQGQLLLQVANLSAAAISLQLTLLKNLFNALVFLTTSPLC